MRPVLVSCVTGIACLLSVASQGVVDTAEYDHVVHPGSADGTGFWNERARWFMYAPAFPFKAVAGAANYRFTVTDDLHETHVFTAKLPTAALAPVWAKLPTGYVTVACEGLDAAGKVVGTAGGRTFWKAAGFEEGGYPKATKPYRTAAKDVYAYVFNMKETRFLLENGRPDPSYELNSYASKILSSLVKGMIRYAELEPSRREEALAVARAAAEYLIAKSEPADAPLAFFPPTYDGRGEKDNGYVGDKYKGQVMLIYPAQVAVAFVRLSETLGEARYLDAAERIAATYQKLRLPDGTWYLKMRAKDGQPVNDNRLVPIESVTPMFRELAAATGKDAYRVAAEKSFETVAARLEDWNWEGQFEDIAPTAPYQNLTKHGACATAIYLAQTRPDDPAARAQVRELLRFAEDQFVCWEPPYRNGRCPSDEKRGIWSGTYDAWITPCALEQYNCYWPIDASAAKMIRTYLAAYRLEGRRADLAKARALGDTATRVQCADGRLPTWWWPARAKLAHADWLNCMMATAEALLQLDEFDGEPPEAPVPRLVLDGKECAMLPKAYELMREAIIAESVYGFTEPFFPPGAAYGKNWWQLDSATVLEAWKWHDFAFCKRSVGNFRKVQKPDGRIPLWGCDKLANSPHHSRQKTNVSSLPVLFKTAHSLATKRMIDCAGTFDEFYLTTDGSAQGGQKYLWTAADYAILVIEDLLGISYDGAIGELKVRPRITSDFRLENLALPDGSVATVSCVDGVVSQERKRMR